MVRKIKLSGIRCIMLHYHPRAIKSTPPILPPSRTSRTS